MSPRRSTPTFALLTLLSVVTAACLWAGTAAAAPRVATLTFEELPFQSVDGISVQGVTFRYTVGGTPSTDAFYGAFGPGSITHVQDPSLEGGTAGSLTLDFSHPTTVLAFGL